MGINVPSLIAGESALLQPAVDAPTGRFLVAEAGFRPACLARGAERPGAIPIEDGRRRRGFGPRPGSGPRRGPGLGDSKRRRERASENGSQKGKAASHGVISRRPGPFPERTISRNENGPGGELPGRRFIAAHASG